MLDKGHSLVFTELFNWGNFNDYHKAVFKIDTELNDQASKEVVSAILGINGSGKSSLIDAIMIALFPFDRLLKLGVTNDSERGTGGGRSSTDYVLGKFASTNGKERKNLSSVYNRSSGTSILNICLQNNTAPHKYISAGIVWFYNNYNIQDRLFYIAQQKVILKDFSGGNGSLPRNKAKFKETLSTRLPGAQVFDTAQAYFSSLSSLLGGITQDDLKIFNRAFYVKSIEDIDIFVRENMLTEESNENLATLLENMANGNEITQQINKCLEKIRDAENILEEFDRLQSIRKKTDEIQRERFFVKLFQLWEPLQKNLEEIDKAKKRIEELNLEKPRAESDESILNTRLQVLTSQLNSSQTTLLLNALEQKKENLNILLTSSKASIGRLKEICEQAKLKMSPSLNPTEMFTAIVKRSLELKEEHKINEVEWAQNRTEETRLLTQKESLRAEIDHLSKNKTLIDPGVYNIKTAAMTALKIPRGNLMFVGELLSVTNSKARVAAESVLEVISRNLLVHPAYLDMFTGWLDKTPIAKSITVKRLHPTDLSGEHDLGPQVENSILNHLEILPTKENPFKSYLAKWLNQSFDYQIVRVEDFKRGKGSLVTETGLIKRDSHTMRKLNKDLRFNLGWDPQEQIEKLTTEFTKTLHDLDKASKKSKELSDHSRDLTKTLDRLGEYKSAQDLHFLNTNHLTRQMSDLEEEISATRKKDQDHEVLQEKHKKVEIEYAEKKNRLSTIESDLRLQEMQLKIYEMETSGLHKSYSNSKYLETLCTLEEIQAIELRLAQERKRLSSGAHLIIDDLEEREADQHRKKDQALGKANIGLTKYSERHKDPHLPYFLKDVSALNGIQKEWLGHRDRLQGTELHGLEEKWRHFFNDILVKSIKDMLNEVKTHRLTIEENITAINEVLKQTYFEKLPDENRFLQIHHEGTPDERVLRFQRSCREIEKLLATPALRMQLESANEEILAPLEAFVNELKDDPKTREYVTDVRNHLEFRVESWKVPKGSLDAEWAETFTGSKYDAKSSAQTTQLAYTLLASSLAYRFKFNDPVAGQLTPRMIILDEFGGKFDNEKPEDIIKMLSQMGFQSLLVSPMSKAELLADSVSAMNFVHKASASKSKLSHFFIQSKEEYDRLVRSMGQVES